MKSIIKRIIGIILILLALGLILTPVFCALIITIGLKNTLIIFGIILGVVVLLYVGVWLIISGFDNQDE